MCRKHTYRLTIHRISDNDASSFHEKLCKVNDYFPNIQTFLSFSFCKFSDMSHPSPKDPRQLISTFQDGLSQSLSIIHLPTVRVLVSKLAPIRITLRESALKDE